MTLSNQPEDLSQNQGRVNTTNIQKAQVTATSARLPQSTEAVSSLQVCANLRALPPGLSPELLEFGRLLADRLEGCDPSPERFCRVALLLVEDLSSGHDRLSGKAIESSLVSAHPEVHDRLKSSVVLLADMACPIYFSNQLRQLVLGSSRNGVGTNDC